MRSSLLRPLSASREIFAQRRSIYEMMIKKIDERRSEEKEIGKKKSFRTRLETMILIELLNGKMIRAFFFQCQDKSLNKNLNISW